MSFGSSTVIPSNRQYSLQPRCPFLLPDHLTDGRLLRELWLPGRHRRTVQFDHQIGDLAFHLLIHLGQLVAQRTGNEQKNNTQGSPVVCDSLSPGRSSRNREKPAPLRVHSLAPVRMRTVGVTSPLSVPVKRTPDAPTSRSVL